MTDIQFEFSSLRIRTVVKSDLPALEWDGEFIHFRRLYADIYLRMERGEGLMWVVELPGYGVIGQVFVSFSKNRYTFSIGSKKAYIYGFRIRPEFRNLGIGSYMMHVVEDDLILRGYNKSTLNVAYENPGALRLYERLGYSRVGHEPGEWSYIDHEDHLQQVTEPAWKMEKKLSR